MSEESRRDFELDAAPGRDAYGARENAGEGTVRAEELEPSEVAPVTGEQVGGAGGLVTGAAIGAATGGPVGAVIGAAVGAAAGVGVAKGVDRLVNPEAEDAYWRENYHTRPYATADRDYEYYRPAFEYGWESRARYPERDYDAAEGELRAGWEERRGDSRMSWEDARLPARDAWERIRF